MMRPTLRTALNAMLLVLLATSCGGGGGDSTTPPSGLVASFEPAQPSPGANTVAMARGSATADVVTVDVNVTDTNDVYGAAFDLFFDSAGVQYVNWSAGNLLEQGGNSPVYNVELDSSDSGHLLVGASRTGSVPPVDVSGTKTLVRLTFRVKQANSFPLSFGAEALFDGQNPPREISGISWFAGSVTGQ